MYTRYSRRAGLRCELLDERRDGKGARSAVLEIRGNGAGRLAGEAGAHAIQHLTRSRRKDRIHTSTATVAVFDAAALTKPAGGLLARGEVRIDTFRGSGAGGQHRNVTDSAVRAVHVPTGEVATVTSGRSQNENRDRAMTVLLARLQTRVRSEHAAAVQQARAGQTQASRAHADRVYDLVRDMVRCGRSGRKVRRVSKVLDGDLTQLLR